MYDFAHCGVRARCPGAYPRGDHVGPTSGLAPGFAQANLVVLPADDALDFLRFCVRNPKPCPLLEVTDTGSATARPRWRATPTCGPICRCYRVFCDGELVDEPTDMTRYWRDDLVGFLLGCSFTFEWALAAAGLPPRASGPRRQRSDVRHESRCVSAGLFEGPLVVSMRPFAPADIPRAVKVSPPLSRHARRPGAYRRSRRARHRRSRHARLRRPRSDRPGRGSRLLGVRRDAAGSRASRRGRRWRSSTRLATCSSLIDPTSTSTLRRRAMTIRDAHEISTGMPNRSVIRRAVRGAAIGNTVEWFDFAIYGFLATYIAEKFFPSG